MYDMLSSAFTDAINREGRVVYTYSDNTHYNVIFRRNKDTNLTTDRVTILYPTDSNIQKGQLIRYSNNYYLVINQETDENAVYYKSDLWKTNCKLDFIRSTGEEVFLPAYAKDIQSTSILSSDKISTIHGDIEFLMSYADIFKEVTFNSYFHAIERYWQVENRITKDDNIIHLFSSVQGDSATGYALSITANDIYGTNMTAKLQTTATYNGSTTITNPTIQWNSSDTSIATVDNSGNATFVKAGTVVFSAYWKEHNIAATKSIEVQSYNLSITADDTYKTTDTPTLTATASIDGIAQTGQTITWNSSNSNIATIDSTGKVTFVSAGTVIFTATWTEKNISATKTVTVTQAVADVYSITITSQNGNNYCYTASPWTFTIATLLNGASSSFDYSYEFTNAVDGSSVSTWFSKAATKSGNNITIYVADNDNLSGKSIRIHVYNTDHNCSTTYDVKVKVAF